MSLMAVGITQQWHPKEPSRVKETIGAFRPPRSGVLPHLLMCWAVLVRERKPAANIGIALHPAVLALRGRVF